MTTIPVFKPLIEDEEIQAATDSLRVGWLGMGASVGVFEESIKAYLGCEDRYVVAVSTGHAALHLAMMLVGLESGDEVITPSFNNIADFQAILAVGAKPVFCDIREDTLCLDLVKAEALIGEKTKAIIAMDYDCCLADHDSLQKLADKYKLRVIHDAAHAFGSSYKGRKVGTFSDICMFSFDPVKTITCIDGGALIVKTKEEVETLHQMRLIGMGQPASVMYGNQRAWTYDVGQLGFRYHMANLHAAIGITQISKMDQITKVRQISCSLYNSLLEAIPEVTVPKSDFSDVTPFLYYIRVPASKRESLRKYLSNEGIDTGIHWQPGHTFSLFRDMKKGDLSVTNQVSKEILSLPLYSSITREEILKICNSIRNFFIT